MRHTDTTVWRLPFLSPTGPTIPIGARLLYRPMLHECGGCGGVYGGQEVFAKVAVVFVRGRRVTHHVSGLVVGDRALPAANGWNTRLTTSERPAGWPTTKLCQRPRLWKTAPTDSSGTTTQRKLVQVPPWASAFAKIYSWYQE